MKDLPDKDVLLGVSQKESALLAHLRSKKYSRIEIEMNEGDISGIYVHEEISPAMAGVEEIVQSIDYQTITITKHDGNLVRIKRRIPIKL